MIARTPSPPPPPPSWDEVHDQFSDWLVNHSKIFRSVINKSDDVPFHGLTHHLAWAEATYKSIFGSENIKLQAARDLEEAEEFLRELYLGLGIAGGKSSDEILRTFRNEAMPVLKQLAGRGHGIGE